MRGFLIDTNVLSELTSPVPSLRVRAFLSAQSDLWFSTIVLHELNYGIELLPQGRKRNRIDSAISKFLTEYMDWILPVDSSVASQAAVFRAQMHHKGRNLDLADALIAATAKVNGLCLVTRNVQDFEHLPIDILNPWESALHHPITEA
ncbi:MAG: PIN domain-containing protein [Gammaproteobacteria bacterium]|nr:PIN domain-containing protein [Gammaproteobacteria bacterium]